MSRSASLPLAPVSLVVRSEAGRSVLHVEVHPGLAAVDKPNLIRDAMTRMKAHGLPATVLVTPFLTYLVADRVVVARSALDGAPALWVRFGAFEDPHPRLWEHFLGATEMLWRRARMGPVRPGLDLIGQAHEWLGRLAVVGEPALCVHARGGVGLAHALLLMLLPQMARATVLRHPGLLAQSGREDVVVGQA